MSYANKTTVPPAQSRSRIESILSRFGCTEIVIGYREDSANVGFVKGHLGVRVSLPMPSREDVRHTATGPVRTEAGARAALEKEIRRRRRSLVLKADPGKSGGDPFGGLSTAQLFGEEPIE